MQTRLAKVLALCQHNRVTAGTKNTAVTWTQCALLLQLYQINCLYHFLAEFDQDTLIEQSLTLMQQSQNPVSSLVI